MRAEIVALNIGGRVYETTKETLRRSAYFEPFLEGRFAHAVDSHGRLFVDRDGKHFAHLLAFMRTLQCPPHEYARKHKAALLEECAFFGLDYMAQRLRGEISPYDMRLEDRALVAAEVAVLRDSELASSYLLDVLQTDTSPLPPEDLRLPLLKRVGERPALAVKTYEQFLEKLDTVTGGLVECFQEVPGLVIAGGGALGALTGTEHGDVDIFLCGLQPEDAMKALLRIFEGIKAAHAARSGAASLLLVTRSKHAVTFFRVGRGTYTPIQVVLSLYESPTALLANFDVDACGFAWCPADKRVVGTPRAVRALRYGVNIADSRFDSGGYTRRLEKYSTRGWQIAVPGFQADRISERVLDANYVYLARYDVLLKTEQTDHLTKELALMVSDFSGQTMERARKRLRGTAVKTCTAVRGFERIVALNHGRKVSTVNPNPYSSDTAVPINIQDGRYTLLWDAKAVDENAQAEDMESYSSSPGESAMHLVELHANREFAQSDEAQSTGFEWCRGVIKNTCFVCVICEPPQ